MNIVKVKDIAVQDLPEGIDSELFTLFKDKYCYCVNWKWLVLFEELTEQQYVYYSQINANMTQVVQHSVEYNAYLEAGLIDVTETDKINSVAKYVEYNKFSPSDGDLSLDQVKRFRTWLAETLYNILIDEEGYDVLEMLNYYKQEMTDDTITHLMHFTPKTAVDVITATNRSTCGCQGGTGLQLLSGVSVCDPIYVYRKAIYEKMVDTFSNIYFWLNRESELLLEIKKYIDFIIAKNLPLTQSQYVSDLYDCGCLTDADASQERLMGILKNLSKAFGLMADGDISKQKNFIGDTLNRWASYLYEIMRWY